MKLPPILTLVRRIPERDLLRMGLFTVVAGLANALVLAVVNHVAELVARGQVPGLGSWLMFLATFGIFVVADRSALIDANVAIETLLRDLRLEVADRVRRSELQVVDRTDRSTLYTLVAQETNHLSATFPVLVDCVQQAALLGCSLVYLGWLSCSAMLLFLLAAAVGVLAFVRIGARLEALLARVAVLNARMLDGIDGIVNGFKELRLNRARSDSVYADFVATSAEAEALLQEFGGHWVWLTMLSTFVAYYLLATVAFVFPDYIPGHTTIILALTPTILFCIGPLGKILSIGPTLARANVGTQAILGAIEALQAGEGADPGIARELAGKFRDFGRIELDKVRFTYRDPAGNPGFTVGPLDLSLARGEIVFLVGGNGSGKSTSLRLLTGLYPPEQGTLQVDGVPLTTRDLAGYRELFSAVFANFHLFDRLYGLGAVDPVEVNALLETMRLSHRIRYENGRFSELTLSTGQQKRLALVVSLLEGRPIHVFDEWPAEQDQEFRAHFYEKILPDLKARGKTVLAVTHDDRYWHVADRVIRLDLGTVTWARTGAEIASETATAGRA